MKSKRLLYYSIGIFLLFSFITFLVHKNLFNQFDFDTTVRLQNFIPRSFDVPFSVFSLLGSGELAGLFLLSILLIYKRLKTLIVLLFFAILHVPELFLKAFVYHPGPAHMFHRYVFDYSFPSSGIKPGSSYPSGHSARAIFVSLIIAFIVSKLKWNSKQKYLTYLIIFIFDALMLVSRVYLGEHWISDVVGGSLLGTIFALLVLALV